MTPLGDAAVRLGAKGFRVFPCQPRRKEPAIKDNLRLAAVDEAIIRRFWGEHGAYNVAIVTGPASGVWVLDIDADHGGEGTLGELEAKHGALPPTIEVITGAGRHLYWRWPAGVDIRNAQHRDDLPGVDWRGDGGYVLAPPSIHPSGRIYAWSVDGSDEFADAPGWLIDLVTARNGKPSNGAPVAATLPEAWRTLLDRVHDGSRRAGLVAKVFGHLIRRNIDAGVAQTLVFSLNHTRNNPPLDPDEIARICDDIADRELHRRGDD